MSENPLLRYPHLCPKLQNYLRVLQSVQPRLVAERLKAPNNVIRVSHFCPKSALMIADLSMKQRHQDMWFG